MNSFLQRLNAKERRGSKPRCHWLTHGSSKAVAARLSALVSPWGSVSESDRWMPVGFEKTQEAQLDKAHRLIDSPNRLELAKWWLPANRLRATTPNFDIASTCSIGGSEGLLLVEAKAHDEELNNERAGRRLAADATEDRRASHKTIGAAIEAARIGMSKATGLEWKISRDSHYQMSNRFAWAWKLTELGIPVVLVYLGFLGANEMTDKGRPFPEHKAWEDLVRLHSEPLFPGAVWNKSWKMNEVPFVPLIKSLGLPLRPVDLP